MAGIDEPGSAQVVAARLPGQRTSGDSIMELAEAARSHLRRNETERCLWICRHIPTIATAYTPSLQHTDTWSSWNL